MNHQDRTPRLRTRLGSLSVCCVVAALPILAGCSSNLEQVLYVGVNAAAGIAVDNWLTALANAVAVSFGG